MVHALPEDSFWVAQVVRAVPAAMSAVAAVLAWAAYIKTGRREALWMGAGLTCFVVTHLIGFVRLSALVGFRTYGPAAAWLGNASFVVAIAGWGCLIAAARALATSAAPRPGAPAYGQR